MALVSRFFRRSVHSKSSALEPITVGHMQLAHRVVLSPLTRCRADAKGVPAPYAAEYYKQRAQAPGSLVITEATAIHGTERGQRGVPGVYSENQVAAWKKVAEAVHSQNSYIFMQLWAMGRKGDKEFLESRGYRQNGASAKSIDNVAPHALTVPEIKEYMTWYADAARRAVREIGTDGVEIHMGNGYLPEQFLRAYTNDRTDEYGGSIESRARFALEIVDSVVAALGDARRVGVRISPWTPSGSVQPTPQTLAEYSYFLGQLQERYPDLAYLSLIEPRMPSGIGDEFAVQPRNGLATDNWNEFVRLAWEGIILRSGHLLDHADAITDKDSKALLAVGKMFISNPDLIERLRNNKELSMFDWTTFYTPGEKGYTDYPNA